MPSRNWWFFLQGILHHYVTVAMVQPMIVGNYKEDGMRVLFTSNNDRASRSFLDAFEFLFSDDRARDSRQLWNVGGSTSSKDKRYCFRKVSSHLILNFSIIILKQKMINACCPSDFSALVGAINIEWL